MDADLKDREEQKSLQDCFVKLTRMAGQKTRRAHIMIGRTYVRGAEDHRPGNVRHLPPQFAVHEIRDPAEEEPDGRHARHDVAELEPVELLSAAKEPNSNRH